jgi:hypothetical protein
MRAFQGFGNINQHTTEFYDKYHSIQTSFNRRFSGGLSFGFNHTLSLLLQGNTGLTKRFDHGPNGEIILRADQEKYEELFKDLNLQRHVFRGNFVWDMPDMSTDAAGAAKVLALLANDWQLTGLFNMSSGGKYDIGYSYQNNGGNVNLTGSPDFGARIKYIGDPGSGCSSNQYRQFNTEAVVGPDYFSDGLESGRNVMQGCANKTMDLSLSRNIRLGGGRAVTVRVDTFNTFNIVNFTGRNTTVTYNNPVDKVIQNSQFNADGTLNQNRLKPQDAGFGAVGNNNVGAMRTVRLTARFSF